MEVCVCVLGREGEKERRVRTLSSVLCEVVNGLPVLPGPVLFVSVLIGLFHKHRCTVVIRQ